MRAQHLIYLLHVWLCVPFLLFWVADPRIAKILSPTVTQQLRFLVAFLLAYMVVRTWIASVDPPRLKWWFVFPPIDVAIITLILCTTHRGPMSNITLLYFLPMVQASGTLNVKWSASVGLMVIAGTTLATMFAYPIALDNAPTSLRELIHDDPLNVAFRVFFLMIISSLMAYQALIAAGYRERLGVEADRNRIAMEMHDGVQGHLIAISSQLELITRVVNRDPVHAAALALEGRESARQAADELRYLVQRLRSPQLESGFASAIKQYAHNFCQRHQLALEIHEASQSPTVSPEIENALFRLSQESLTNIVKHAHATKVAVNLIADEDSIELSIQDNGDGFGLEDIPHGSGLKSMEERVKNSGGFFSLESTPGSGTRVTATFTLGSKYV